MAAPNARWSIDIVHDQLSPRSGLKILSVTDSVSRKGFAAVVDTSVLGRRSAGNLRCYSQGEEPGLIATDYGSEFSSTAILT